jgi:hypothetical protein
MLEAFKEKTPVVIVKSIAGLAEPKYDLQRPFEFQPGMTVSLNSKLAALWTMAGIAKPIAAVTPEELVDMKILASKF